MEKIGEIIRGYVQRHRSIIGGISSLITATVFFIPSSSRYYEVIAEGIYAVSKLVDYAANLVLQSKADQWKSVQFYTCEATRLLAVLEVFIERYSQNFPAVLNYESTILWIESIKGICRLFLIYNGPSSSMIINWFRSEGCISLESNTIVQYRALCDSKACDFVRRMVTSTNKSGGIGGSSSNNDSNNNSNSKGKSSSSNSKTGFVNLSSPVGLEMYNSPFVSSPVRRSEQQQSSGAHSNNNPKSSSFSPSLTSKHDILESSSPSPSLFSPSALKLTDGVGEGGEEEESHSFKNEQSSFQGRRSGITLMKSSLRSSGLFDNNGDDNIVQIDDLNFNSNNRSSSSNSSMKRDVATNEASGAASNSSSPGKTTCSDSQTTDTTYDDSLLGSAFKSSNILEDSDFIDDDIAQIYETDGSGGISSSSSKSKSKSSSSKSRNISSRMSAAGGGPREDISPEFSESDNRSLLRRFIAHVKNIIKFNPLSSTSSSDAEASASSTNNSSMVPSTSWFNSNEGEASKMNATSYISNMSPNTLLTFGEILYVLRPVIYALLLQKGSHRLSTSVAASIPPSHPLEVAGIKEPYSANSASGFNGGGGVGGTGATDNVSAGGGVGESSLILSQSRLYYKSFAIIVSLITELVSIKLTEAALKRVREQSIIGAIQEFKSGFDTSSNNNINNNKKNSNNNSSNSNFSDIAATPMGKGSNSSNSYGYWNGNSNSNSNSNSNNNSSRLSVEIEMKLFMAFQNIKMNHQFDEELKRRKTYLFFYLLRSPVFDKVSLPILKVVSRIVSGIPLVNSLPESIISILQYFNKTHFYNSSSS